MHRAIRRVTLVLIAVCGLALVAALGGVGAPPAVAAGAWHNAAVTLNFSASDSGSGVAFTEYSFDNGGTWTRGASVAVTAQGVTPVLYRSADKAGKLETGKSVSDKILGVALYAGGNTTLSGSSKVTSPLIGGLPSAAVYVLGKLTTSGLVDLSSTAQFVTAKGATVPPLSQFMPDARITSLTQASQAAQQTGTVYNGLTYSGTQNVTFTAPITVKGNLTISGSGSYTFDSVFVTGNVTISSPAGRISFAALRVGGSLTVSGAAAAHDERATHA